MPGDPPERGPVFTQLANLLSALPVPAIVVDEARNVHLVNAAAERAGLGGRSDPCHAILLGQRAPCDVCVLGEALAGEGGAVLCHHDLAPAPPQRTLAIAFSDTDGSRWVVELIPPHEDPAVHPGGAIQEEAIRSTLEVTSDAVVYFDVRLAVVLANRAADETLGVTTGDLVGRSLVDLGILESAGALAEVFAAAGTELTTRRPVVLRRRDGATAPAEARLTLLQGAPGRLVGACSFPPPASWTWTAASPVVVATEPALPAVRRDARRPPDEDDLTPLPVPAPMVAPITTLRSRLDAVRAHRPVTVIDPTPLPAPLAVAETIPPAPVEEAPPLLATVPLAETDRGAVPAAEVVVLIAGDPLRISAITDEVTALLGQPPEAFMGITAETWFERVHEPDLAAELRAMWQGLAGQQFELHALPEQIVTYPFLRVDGSTVPCRTVWRAIQDGEGWFRGVELLIRPER